MFPKTKTREGELNRARVFCLLNAEMGSCICLSACLPTCIDYQKLASERELDAQDRQGITTREGGEGM